MGNGITKDYTGFTIPLDTKYFGQLINILEAKKM